LRALAPFAVFSIWLAIGVALWTFSQRVGAHQIMRLAIATTTALTLAHYWIDQFLWKFASAERREWLAQSYRFVNVQATTTAKRPALV